MKYHCSLTLTVLALIVLNNNYTPACKIENFVTINCEFSSTLEETSVGLNHGINYGAKYPYMSSRLVH